MYLFQAVCPKSGWRDFLPCHGSDLELKGISRLKLCLADAREGVVFFMCKRCTQLGALLE